MKEKITKEHVIQSFEDMLNNIVSLADSGNDSIVLDDNGDIENHNWIVNSKRIGICIELTQLCEVFIANDERKYSWCISVIFNNIINYVSFNLSDEEFTKLLNKFESTQNELDINKKNKIIQEKEKILFEMLGI